MEKNKNYLNLKKFCRSLDVDLFGVAKIREVRKDFMLPEEISGKFDKAISLGLSLSQNILEEIHDAPTKLYFHHYRIANSILDQAAFKVSNYIQRKGFFALSIPASQIIDWQNQKAHLSHKKIGYLAGLGWLGRNNLLVNKELGSHFRLVSILTDMPLKTDKPKEQVCGECRLCIEVCPVGAIKEEPKDFDHIRCFEKLKDFQRKRLVDQYICGICVNICRKKQKQERKK